MDKFLLEICVVSYESALAAYQGGADRIELCADLMIGGTTPTPWLFQQIQKKINLPCRVLIRLRFGDFCYSEAEFEQMTAAVRAFRTLGADGVAAGCLTTEGTLDPERMQRLREAAGSDMAFTLHRAFDMTVNPEDALEQAIAVGADTILTSGQRQSAEAGADLLGKLVRQAERRVNILVGSGVNACNIAALYEKTRATHYHMSGKTVVDSRMKYRNPQVNMGMAGLSEYELWRASEEKIRAAKDIMLKLGKR